MPPIAHQYPYLPVLTGRVVESIEVSERFLTDFRRTIADCIHDDFYAYMSELCEAHGMTFSSEPFTRTARMTDISSLNDADAPGQHPTDFSRVQATCYI